MTILFVDGFDHYGTTRSNMTDGAWAEVDLGVPVSLTTLKSRTGTHSLRVNTNTVSVAPARRVLGGAKTTVGVAAAFWLSDLPNVNNRFFLYDYRDTANSVQLTVVLQSTGIIEVMRGTASGTSIGATTVPAMTAGAWTHVETLTTFNDTTGSCEIRVNGVTVLSITGADTVNTSNVESSQVSFLPSGGVLSIDTGVDAYIDDVYCYDDSGAYNNTFIGDKKVFTLFPNADTAQDDWTRNTGSVSFENIDEADPDDDTTYLYANPGGSPNIVSEFELDNLPADVTAISAVVTVNRLKKTDAGTADVTSSLVSAVSESTGTSNPMTTAYTYYHDVFEADPDTSSPFTPTAVDALKVKVERTA